MNAKSTSTRDVLTFDEIDPSADSVGLVGGKGLHLAALARIEGVRVPAGFCVTTAAFRRVTAAAAGLHDAVERLRAADRAALREESAAVRRIIESAAVPDDLAAAVARALEALGAGTACAVRSSATAEDSPSASFAGQQDTYLNVIGAETILAHIRRCWASLFTERAVAYRARNGFDHHGVQMCVVVQRMIFPDVSGVAFTADPVTSHRKVVSIEATFGLGEALVSGIVNADVYKVQDGAVVSRAIASKERAVVALPTGGTEQRAVEPARQKQAALTDAQVLRLAQLARRIEAHFGAPQDIEWCLAGDELHVVQSRPITTLFPIPAAGDDERHVYISVGHGQMMTDALKPLGLSLRQLTSRPMFTAAGRQFVDVAKQLASPARAGLVATIAKGDPLTGDALRTLLERDGVILADTPGAAGANALHPGTAPIEADPRVVDELIERSRRSLADLRRDLKDKSGPALFDFLLADFEELKRLLFDPKSFQAFMAGMESTWWINDHMQEWLGDKNAADTLAHSAPNNVTAEMGLALLDVADVIRPHRVLVEFLERAGDHDDLLDELAALPGGAAARDAIRAWLDRYGMRCVGEVDITRPRFSERPSTLVPSILTNVKSFAPGEARRRFDAGHERAQKKEEELLRRLRALPGGEEKAAETKRHIDRVRAFTGYREYPKYGLIARFFLYKQALLREAERLAQSGALAHAHDAFFLTFEELRDAVRTNRVDPELIRARKVEQRAFEALTPPRVMTSDGEVIIGRYRREDVPPGALVGLAVSAGTVEGRARVVFDLGAADLQPGDILVTPMTDPSWTPAFVAIAGLVTEVGGLMTHGAVIAREYGVPAVVGVEGATRAIRDGERIRVHGTEGFVELLDRKDA